jgi:hypothetical protein
LVLGSKTQYVPTYTINYIKKKKLTLLLAASHVSRADFGNYEVWDNTKKMRHSILKINKPLKNYYTRNKDERVIKQIQIRE